MEDGAIVYFFDKNGNEVVIGDLVYIQDDRGIEYIGRILWPRSDSAFGPHVAMFMERLDGKTSCTCSLSKIRKVPDTIAMLLKLEQ